MAAVNSKSIECPNCKCLIFVLNPETQIRIFCTQCGKEWDKCTMKETDPHDGEIKSLRLSDNL